VTTVYFVSGTKQYTGVRGTLVASGTLNFVSGQGVGTYTGSIDK